MLVYSFATDHCSLFANIPASAELLYGQLNGTLTGHGQTFYTLKYSIISIQVPGLHVEAS